MTCASRAGLPLAQKTLELTGPLHIQTSGVVFPILHSPGPLVLVQRTKCFICAGNCFYMSNISDNYFLTPKLDRKTPFKHLCKLIQLRKPDGKEDNSGDCGLPLGIHVYFHRNIQDHFAILVG